MHYYCAKWPGYAAVPAGTALQRGEACTIRSGNAVCVGAVDKAVEEVVELTLVMAMEVLLDHGKLRNDRRWHSQSRGSMGDHRSGLHTATCASMPPDLRFSAIISDGGKVAANVNVLPSSVFIFLSRLFRSQNFKKE